MPLSACFCVQLWDIHVGSTFGMHVRMRVRISLRVCARVNLCLCLRCRCFVSLMRGVQGLHGGLWKIIFSCFAMKALSRRNRRNSLKWRRARLNYSALTINFGPHLISTPPRTTGPAGSSWECWQFPVQCTLRPRGNMRGCGSMDFFLWVCNLVCWIIKPPPTCCFTVIIE